MTAPRTSPLTEEEAHRRWHEARGWSPPPPEWGFGTCAYDCRRGVAALLRVDSEARAEHGRKSPALLRMTEKRDDLRVELVAARADLDEAVRLLDEMRGKSHVYRPNCEWPPESGARCTSCRVVEFTQRLKDRHPTPSTPTTTEET